MANGRFCSTAKACARTKLDDAYSRCVADADADVVTMKLNRVVLLCLGCLLVTLTIVTAHDSDDSDSDDSSSDSSDSESDDSDHPGSVSVIIAILAAAFLWPPDEIGGTGAIIFLPCGYYLLSI